MGEAGQTVLVVDDEPAMREFLEHRVPWGSLGFQRVEAAVNGVDALGKIKTLKPLLVIMDIKMPGLDGVGLLERLEEERYEYPLAVVALSGYRDFEAAQRMVAMRWVTEYLLKPAMPEELLAASERSLNSLGLDVHAPVSSEKKMTRQQELVAQAKNWIDEHFSDRVSLSSVAEQVHVAPAYLSRVFAAEDPRGFSGYLSWVRVQHAKRMLSQTHDTVASVGVECGFVDVRQFLRTFKKVEGCTPSEYRRGAR